MGTSLARIEVTGPIGNLDHYIQAVNAVAVLSVEEEQELARRYALEQDLDAARQLVLAHLRFVVHIARSYSGYGLAAADLIQEGNIGLMKAVKRFDPSYGVRLVTFAVHWIKAEIHEFILRNWRIVKVATTKAQRKLFFNLRSGKKRLGWLNNDEVHAMAADLGVEPAVVREMEGRMSGQDLSYDGSPDDNDESAVLPPCRLLEDRRADPARMLEGADWEEDASARLREAIKTLDERSRDILKRRWLDEDSKPTLHDLAEEYGVSAERIRQIEKGAMIKVRKAMEAA